MDNYFDTSTSSIVIGIVTFVLVLLLFRYIMNSKTEEKDTTSIILYSMLAGLISSIIVLLLYKQFLIYKGSITYIDKNYDAEIETSS